MQKNLAAWTTENIPGLQSPRCELTWLQMMYSTLLVGLVFSLYGISGLGAVGFRVQGEESQTLNEDQ